MTKKKLNFHPHQMMGLFTFKGVYIRFPRLNVHMIILNI